jgi:ATP-dependent Lon protease
MSIERSKGIMMKVQKYRLMSSEEHQAALAEIVARHSWMEAHIFTPAPGHLAVAETLLKQIERCLSPSDLNEFPAFCIMYTEGLVVSGGRHDESRNNSEVLRSLFAQARKQASWICPACGRPTANLNLRSQWRCPQHREGSIFHVHDLELARRGRMAQSRKKKKEQDAKLKPKEKAPETPAVKIPVFPGPTIVFLEEARLDIFPFAPKHHKDADEKRAKAIVTRIKIAGNDRRQLAVLPDDWESVLDEFNRAFPNFSALTQILRTNFALQSLGDHRVYWPPILLFGEPGIGKTEVARWLAERLAMPFRIFDMASAQSSSQLAGSEAFWSNSEPGLLFSLLAFEMTANPVCVLDELDKVDHQDRYNPLAALYTLLEHRSAQQFIDLSIQDFSIDASHVNWMATANRLDSIPKPLLNRMTVLEIPAPNREQMRVIAGNIYRILCRDAVWGKAFPETLSEVVIERLADRPPRTLFPCLQNALGAAAQAGRREILPQDIMTPSKHSTRSIGFTSGP